MNDSDMQNSNDFQGNSMSENSMPKGIINETCN